MKEERELLIIVILAVGLLSFSCTSTGYNTQRGVAIGAGIGAIAGQLIGRNTAGTLIGAGAGALAGAIVGNAMDQNQARSQARPAYQERRVVRPAPAYVKEQRPRETRVAASSVAPAYEREQPPGQWVDVPGQWVGSRWIRAHKAWVPVNP